MTKDKNLLLALVISLVITTPAHGQQIVQVTTGWCSPTIANVVGDVHIECIGVSPKAHQKLNEELDRLKQNSNLKIEQLVAKADEWAKRYHEIKNNLENLVTSPEEIRRVNQLIVDGELEKAASQLDKEITQLQNQLGSLAEVYYLRAGVYLLKFDERNAIKHIELAYRTQPKNPKYLLAYVSTLIGSGQFSAARNILVSAIPSLRDAFKNGSTEDAISFANALDKLGAIYIQTHETDRLRELSEETTAVIIYLKDSSLSRNENLELASLVAFSLGRNNLIIGNRDVAENFFGVSFGWYLELCSKSDGNFCANAANAASMTGTIDSLRSKYRRAILRYELAIDTLKAVDISNLYRNEVESRILHGKAQAHLQLGDKNQAATDWKRIINLQQGGKFASLAHKIFVAHSYIELGQLELSKGNYDQGEAYLRKALSLTEQPESDAVEIEKALTLVNLGHLYAATSSAELARQYASKAANIYYKHWKKSPNEYKSYYARSLYVYGGGLLLDNERAAGCKWLRHAHDIDPGGVWDEFVVERIHGEGCR